MADLEAKERKKREKQREDMQKQLEEYNEMLTEIYVTETACNLINSWV